MLSYIGMAVACGESLKIPFIIRSLSRDFYKSTSPDHLNIPLDRSFLLALEAGLFTTTGTKIENFLLDWWNLKGLGRVMVTLNSSNLDECLRYHKQQIRISTENATASDNDLNSNFSKPHYIWKPNTLEAISTDDSCTRCRLYRAVALGTHDEQRDIQNHINASEVSLSAQKLLVMRRASGFNQLFEYLTIKEVNVDADAVAANDGAVSITQNVPAPHLSNDPPDLPPLNLRSKKGKKYAGRRDLAETVRQVAVTEVGRLQNMPGLKWTWGIDLSLSELGELHRSADTGHKLPHSGYDTSLPSGSNTRSDPGFDKLISGDDEFCTDIADDIQSVPDLHPDNFPPYPQLLSKKRSIYLKSLYDDPVGPMDSPYPSTVAPSYVVPPPLPMPVRKLLPLPLPYEKFFEETQQGI